jgi:hypothetical protein
MSQPGRPPADLPPPISVGSLSRRLSFPTSGLVFDAPPGGANGQVSPEQAYNACLTDAAYPRGKGGPAIYLALATSTFRPAHWEGAKLVYLLRWEGVMLVPGGPPGSDGSPNSSTWTTVIDAISGRAMRAIQATAEGT